MEPTAQSVKDGEESLGDEGSLLLDEGPGSVIEGGLMETFRRRLGFRTY
jgi:hypothetical protein